MTVSAVSRTLSAISLGVRWRSDPSTSAIIRSTKDWPGSLVIRTTIRSESTVVPPVTALRSPPDSRITGADSPVTADSSTDATPSMTSPSPGIRSPATTTTTSPSRRLVLGTSSVGSSVRLPVYFRVSLAARTRRAVVSCCRARRLAAWALPRPSATDSARFAKSTVSHSQTVTIQPSTLGSLIESTVVATAPASTTSITGVRAMARGSSLRSAPRRTSRSRVRFMTGTPRPARGRARARR